MTQNHVIEREAFNVYFQDHCNLSATFYPETEAPYSTHISTSTEHTGNRVLSLRLENLISHKKCYWKNEGSGKLSGHMSSKWIQAKHSLSPERTFMVLVGHLEVSSSPFKCPALLSLLPLSNAPLFHPIWVSKDQWDWRQITLSGWINPTPWDETHAWYCSVDRP